ncbi:hypothetical protein [Actimicrobium antarcticum]|uniref:Uncharacterized protein n=1 Tax=Actimicrobium antarcticum TaxID=1051899 RepID=A0ABP7SSJ5_9BURK
MACKSLVDFEFGIGFDAGFDVGFEVDVDIDEPAFSRKASLTINQLPRLGLVLTLNSA